MNLFKKLIIITIIAFVTIFLQSAILKSLLPNLLIPNLLLSIIIFLSFYETNVFGLFVSFLLGLLLDISTSNLLGPLSASFVTVYTICTMLSGRIFIDTTISLMLITAISSVICDFIYIILMFTFLPNIENISLNLLIGCVTTAICSPFMIFILKKYYSIKTR